MDDIEVETDIHTQELLLAASNHDVAALRNLLRNSSANVQDPETGFTPLHAAIAAFEDDEDSNTTNGDSIKINGHTNGDTSSDNRSEELQKAAETVRLLFQNGAIWNDLDSNNETPGCIAHRLGLKELYDLIVDAGVRAELLLSRLDEYQLLPDAGDEEEEEEEEEDDDEELEDGDFQVINRTEETSVENSGVLVQGSSTGAENKTEEQPTKAAEADVNSEDYLTSVLRYTDKSLLDADNNGVMMSWETDIMKRSADLLAPKTGLRVLNVGFGMGIIDGIFQEKSPAAHHIIEAHPNVVQKIKQDGWDKKDGVFIHEGRWQDVLPGLLEKGDVMFDAIYFDTFAEDYKALREFFSEYAVQLLDPEGRFGFFNGLGADRQVVYDVYTKIVEMDLFEAGFDTEWENIAVPDLQAAGEWNGVRRRYWVPETYRLPTCKLIE